MMRLWLVVAVALFGMSAPASATQRGGHVTFLSSGDIDYLDPGQTYYGFGYAVQFAVNRALYGFPAGARHAVPDLAAGPPEIAPDRRSLTVRLRPDVNYAPPVDRAVKAADVKYAIERAFSRRVPSGYATTYFRDLVGAPRRPTARIPSITGIETPDDLTVVFRLRRASADVMAAALVLPITVPVPREYAAQYDGSRPSRYDGHVAFTGPYVVTKRDDRRIELRRNPNWDPDTDYRPAYLDAVSIRPGHGDLAAAARRALSGKRLLCCDAPPRLRVRRSRQVGEAPAGGTRYVALNTQVAPFDRPLVRKAAIVALDRRRLARLRPNARVAQHFLPPGVGGHARTDVRGLDFLAHPGGSRRAARRYLRAAGYRPRRHRPVFMVATGSLLGRRIGRSVARDLRGAGFRVRLKLVPNDVLFTRYCGVPRRRVAICPEVGWFKDFDDPQNLLEPTFSGRFIRPAGNVNWAQLDVPRINRAMDAAAVIPAGAKRDAAWARINRSITAKAPAAPYSWERYRAYASRDLDAVMNAYSGTWDFTATGFRS